MTGDRVQRSWQTGGANSERPHSGSHLALVSWLAGRSQQQYKRKKEKKKRGPGGMCQIRGRPPSQSFTPADGDAKFRDANQILALLLSLPHSSFPLVCWTYGEKSLTTLTDFLVFFGLSSYSTSTVCLGNNDSGQIGRAADPLYCTPYSIRRTKDEGASVSQPDRLLSPTMLRRRRHRWHRKMGGDSS
jgi:hypothetical protein